MVRSPRGSLRLGLILSIIPTEKPSLKDVMIMMQMRAEESKDGGEYTGVGSVRQTNVLLLRAFLLLISACSIPSRIVRSRIATLQDNKHGLQ